ncbi:MAG TPA: mycothiol system anti-sigma-R factor [Acidimicrobiia bacterium]|nr:mycothiol system anti-sigma-R factor [Acidimicrobiia bacterium]
MKRACDQALAEIYLYLDRELTWWRRRQIRRHLAECPPCLEGYAFERRLKIVVRECLAEEVPEEFLIRLNEAIQRERYRQV